MLCLEDVSFVVDAFKSIGLDSCRTAAEGVDFPDTKDIVFYEVAISKEGSFLVTGNTRHFPKEPIVVTPAQMLQIILNAKEKEE